MSAPQNKPVHRQDDKQGQGRRTDQEKRGRSEELTTAAESNEIVCPNHQQHGHGRCPENGNGADSKGKNRRKSPDKNGIRPHGDKHISQKRTSKDHDHEVDGGEVASSVAATDQHGNCNKDRRRSSGTSHHRHHGERSPGTRHGSCSDHGSRKSSEVSHDDGKRRWSSIAMADSGLEHMADMGKSRDKPHPHVPGEFDKTDVWDRLNAF